MAETEHSGQPAEKGICVLDAQEDLLFANAGLAALLKVESGQALVGKSFDAFLTPESYSIWEKVRHGDYQTLVPARVSLRCPDGRSLPVHLTFHVFRSDANELTGGVLIITPRSLGVASDEDRSERLEMVLEAGELGAWSLDMRTGLSWRTDFHDRIFGYESTVPEWSYEAFLAHVIEADRPIVRQSLAEAMKAQTAWEFECRIRRIDGVQRWIWAQGRLERDVQGEIVAMFGVLRDITDRKAAEEQIEFLAYYDPLTQLPNRRLMMDRLGRAVRAAARSGEAGAIFFIDLDDFKTLNDTLGHQTGDQMLLEVARRLLSCLRAQDTVARFGGDEFVVMMEGLGEDEAEVVTAIQQVADKILEAIERPYDFSVLKHRRTTCSIGVATFGSTRDTPDLLLRHADIAMYRAKAAGGHDVHFYEPQMQVAIDARVALESEIQMGLRRSEFLLYYQPQVDLAGETTAAEALLRWQHPRRGLLAPGEFIPAAEASGLIVPLGAFVIHSACRQLAVWAHDRDMARASIAVNISARQFHHPGFVDEVFEALDASGVDARRLTLELTESVLLDCIDDAAGRMARLKARGVRFSLDDFGTGYSSLYYLKRLPLDQLKIDQRFVAEVLTNSNDIAIVRTIITLANALGLSVIAEGVENQQASGVLLAHDCHLQQGFLFGQPLPFEGFEIFVRGQPIDLASRGA
jgi:diguanylate cyclase (GGDEF)-like protein/PAS domain S-box-containing protein